MKQVFIIVLISCLFSCSENKTNVTHETSKNNENLTPEEVVRTFIEELGAREFKNAFEKQKVKAWGNLEKFSSVKSFGGIVKTKINKIESKPDENSKAVVETETFYADKENGDNTFKQIFYLQKFGGKWKIVKMRLKKTNKKIRFKRYEFEKKTVPNKSAATFEIQLALELPLNNPKLLKAIIKSINKGSKANTAQEYFKETYNNYNEMDDEATSNWDYGETGNVIYNNNKILCYAISGGGYLGGAHGFHFSTYFTYNLKNSKVIKLGAIFDSNNYFALQKKIYNEIKTSRELSDQQMQDIYFELPILPSENFYINKKGIGFYYDSYAISPYSNGSDEAFFTFDVLEGMIKTSFKKEFLN